MTFSFHPDAELELNEAIEYYERRTPGLGYDFSVEVGTTIQTIISHPEAWPVVAADLRRSLVKRFPYAVLYTVEQDHIHVLAVMHVRRSPGYWRGRI
ncbi:MAG: type II toxin-antitoxin system RelE/ParE family toxin [Thermodesulfobacteriota bacterium]